jgi:hypothetical protein
MVEADHAGGVAVEVEGSSADSGPVGRVPQEGSVQVRIVVERARDSEPVTMGGFTRAVGPDSARSDPSHIPRAGLVDALDLWRQVVGERYGLGDA